MSWIRSAVSKAVEVGGNSNLTRAVRGYADTVVNQAGQAVVGGAKLFQDRIGARNYQSYKLAVKRLEEVSVSCRGVERVQLLRRWLVSLKEIERHNEDVTEHVDKYSELNDFPAKPTMVLYYDPDFVGEPMNFRDVFLHSQALEGITLSLILEEPDEEELSLLLEIYRLCLTGGKEAHDLAVSSVRDLAKACSTYDEEVLAKREELLQYAQDAIAGLKVNAEIVRIDSEVSDIHKKLEEMKDHLPLSEDLGKSSEISIENLKEALRCIRFCSRLEELLLQKKLIKNGDSPASHNHKIDKLKVLSESLASSTVKAQKRISENRIQKEEALKFRLTKTSEVSILEKELIAEIKALDIRKDELEEELKKVNTSLTSARARLHNAREERDQFDEASNEIVQHFSLKDDELSKSIASYRAEAEVCSRFVKFLQSTWFFQSSHAKLKEKLVNDELEKHEEYFLNFAVSTLSAYKEQLGPCIASVRDMVENFKRLDGMSTTGEEVKEKEKEKDDAITSRKTLEEHYHSTSAKLITAFSVVDSINKHFSTTQVEDSRRRDDGHVKELLEALENLRSEFESIEKPSLLFVVPTMRMRQETPPKRRNPRVSFLSQKQQPPKERFELNLESNEAQRGGISLPFTPIITLPLVRSRSLIINTKKSSDAEAQLSMLKLELELENHSRRDSLDGIFDWEFDEKFEREHEIMFNNQAFYSP